MIQSILAQAAAWFFDNVLVLIPRFRKMKEQIDLQQATALENQKALEKRRRLELMMFHKILVKRLKEAPRIREARLRRERKAKRKRDLCGFKLKHVGTLIDRSAFTDEQYAEIKNKALIGIDKLNGAEVAVYGEYYFPDYIYIPAEAQK